MVPSFAFSQETPDAETPPPAAEADPGDTDVKKARKDAERRDAPQGIGGIDAEKVPTPAKQAKVEKMLSEQRKILGRATNLLSEARAAKDIVQLNCVNEKLTQIKGLLKISESGSANMYTAIGNGKEDIVNHEYTKISVAHQRSVSLGAEAEQCVGEIAVYTGQTEVTVEIDDDLVENDPTVPPPVGPAPEVPPVASPR